MFIPGSPLVRHEARIADMNAPSMNVVNVSSATAQTVELAIAGWTGVNDFCMGRFVFPFRAHIGELDEASGASI